MEVRRFDLTYLRRESRGALDVELEIRGKLLRVIVTHLGLLPAERRYQVKQLLQIVGDFPLLPVIVLGDLNEWFLLGRPARWLHRYFGYAPAPRTFPAFFPVFSLDRIMARPRSSLLDIRAVRTADSRLASDHLPVKGRIAIP
jgi:endonuclease/exonuclease/phosphatase family metal-dependent hydrolase